MDLSLSGTVVLRVSIGCELAGKLLLECFLRLVRMASIRTALFMSYSHVFSRINNVDEVLPAYTELVLSHEEYCVGMELLVVVL